MVEEKIMTNDTTAIHPDSKSRMEMLKQHTGGSIQPSKQFMNRYKTYAGKSDVRVKKLNDSATIPTKANHLDAGWDLYSTEQVLIESNERTIVKTGIALHIPDRYVGLIWPRSGMAVKYGIDVFAGVSDAGYRGEVGVCLYNSSDKDFYVQKGDRIAQILFQKVSQHNMIEVQSLEDSERGEGGFGSSGV